MITEIVITLAIMMDIVFKILI